MRRRRGVAGWRVKVAAFSAWIAVVSLFFLWETSQYRGFIAMLAEWQFNNFGRYFPTLTFAIVVFVLSLPGYLVFLRPQRSKTSEIAAVSTRSARIFWRALTGVAVGLCVTAIGTLLAMLWLPSSQGEAQHYSLQGERAALPHEGLTQLSGVIAYDRVSAFDQELLVARRNVRFAPVFPTANPTSPVQFFVELPAVDRLPATQSGTMTGILRQGGLPGEIVNLYHYAGYAIDRPYFVLFVDPGAMRWPYISAAIQLLIGASLAAIMAWAQSRRFKRRKPAAGETQS